MIWNDADGDKGDFSYGVNIFNHNFFFSLSLSLVLSHFIEKDFQFITIRDIWHRIQHSVNIWRDHRERDTHSFAHSKLYIYHTYDVQTVKLRGLFSGEFKPRILLRGWVCECVCISARSLYIKIKCISLHVVIAQIKSADIEKEWFVLFDARMKFYMHTHTIKFLSKRIR